MEEVLPEMMPVGKAARRFHIDGRTLRRWLESERGLVLPRLGKGASPLVKIADVQALLAKHGDKRRYTGEPS
jgi:hypothetical protein